MRERKVLFVGQTPPPLHGQAIAIERFVKAPKASMVLVHVRMQFSDVLQDVGRFRVRKLWRLLTLIYRILKAQVEHRADVLCYAPAGPATVPILRDMAVLTVIRPFFRHLAFDVHAAGLGEFETSLPRPLRPLFRWTYHRADLVIERYDGDPPPSRLPAKIRAVVPNGIPDESFERDSQPHAKTSVTLLYVGVLALGKGLWTLVDALELLRDEAPQVRLVLVGEPESLSVRDQLQERLARHGLEQRIRLTGRLEGSAKLREFAQADIFCFPSRYSNEALPLAVLEAMQWRLPVIGSNWRGIATLVEDGRSGFLITPEDPEALAAKVRLLAADPDLRRVMGEAGREAYLRRFTLDRYVEGMETALLSLF